MNYVILTVEKFVEAEDKFIDLAYDIGDQEDMTKQNMKDYIRYLADFRLGQVGLPSMFNQEENPLVWMDWLLSGKKHTNFFEERVADYSHDPLKGGIDFSIYKQDLSYHPPKSVDTSEVYVVYGTGWCHYCKRVVDFFKENGIDFEYFDLDEDSEAYDRYLENGHATIPQVYSKEGEYIGGHDDTLMLLGSSGARV